MRRSGVFLVLLALGCPDGACGDTFVVTSLADAGLSTLRAHITAANDSAGPDTILFANTLSGTITLTSDLPTLSDNGTHIWGETAVPDDPMPDIEIAAGGPGMTGMLLMGAQCMVRGLEFTGFDTAISILGGQSNTIGGAVQAHQNIITGNGTGILLYAVDCEANILYNNLVHGNTGDGIHLRVGAVGNIVGGSCAFCRNLSSNNGGHGIHLDATPDPVGTIHVSRNWIHRNIVGMTLDGLTGWGNGLTGIHLQAPGSSTCDSNQVFSNLVSDNGGHGIALIGQNVFGNAVADCKIGTDRPGAAAFGNGFDGVHLRNGAHDNVIGPGSLVSANQRNGVRVDGAGCDRNLVVESTIGLDLTGTYDLGNGSSGVYFLNGCSEDTVRQCLVSANGGDGILLQDLGTDHHVVELNRVGTDATGRVDLDNGAAGEGGIFLDDGPQYCVVDGNLVAGHADAVPSGRYGIRLRNDNTMYNRLSNNVVGLDVDTAASLPNHYGVYFENCVFDTVGPGNVISGNTSYGILLAGSSHFVFGNRIGTDSAGLVAFGNQSGIYIEGAYCMIGGPAITDGNLVSGNDEWGIEMHNWTSFPSDILVQNNVVGETAAGGAMGNGSGGIWIGQDFQFNEIGDLSGATGNRIANNGYTSPSGGPGILVGEDDWPCELGNIIGSNSITANAGKGIELSLALAYPGNEAIPAPYVTSATTAAAQGTIDAAITAAVVQVFVDPADEGAEYMGNASFTSATDWEFVFTTPPVVGQYVTATVTGTFGTADQTSEFSTAVVVSPAGTDVAEGATGRPERLELTVEAPGSSSGETTIRFSTPVPMHVRLHLYDVTGRLVCRLREGVLPAGTTDIQWDGRDAAGHTVASGVYLLEAVHAEGRQVRKLTLVR